MGCASSIDKADEASDRDRVAASAAAALPKKVDEVKDDGKILKLLLLGAGESGKSTFFKQAITLYGKGHSDADRKEYASAIFAQIVGSFQSLLYFSKALNPPCPVEPENAELADRVRQELDQYDISHELPLNIALAFLELWKDAGINATYERRTEYQLPDSLEYFMKRISDVFTDGYLPTPEDILRVRHRSTGIIETNFLVKGRHFQMFDVGGQRTERRKWVNCFEGVTAVLFVAAISEYDMRLFEDETCNRISEALVLFSEIINAPAFHDASIVLFLNKRDLFEAKIKRVPLSVCPDFADYMGSNNFDECCKYITQQFESKRKGPAKNKKVYTHFTTATDTDNARNIWFDTVIVIDEALKKSHNL